jgi:hypothetical protein
MNAIPFLTSDDPHLFEKFWDGDAFPKPGDAKKVRLEIVEFLRTNGDPLDDFDESTDLTGDGEGGNQ